MNRRQFIVSTSILPITMAVPIQARAASSLIHQLKGTVNINQRPITVASHIQSGDKIVVSQDGQLVFCIGEDAFLLRGGSEVQIKTDNNLLVTSLRLITGALLGVFGKRNSTTFIHTSTATIGIRGTAVYVAASPHECYTCTCYGRTDLIVGKQKKEVVATHHNPHLVSSVKKGMPSMKIHDMINHNDDELRMLESLVGRKPIFDV